MVRLARIDARSIDVIDCERAGLGGYARARAALRVTPELPVIAHLSEKGAPSGCQGPLRPLEGASLARDPRCLDGVKHPTGLCDGIALAPGHTINIDPGCELFEQRRDAGAR